MTLPASQAPTRIAHPENTHAAGPSSPWAIRMEGIGKQYRIGGPRRLNDNIREDLMRGARGLFGRARAIRDAQLFWALKDIDLEIARGETLGIIGGNGAGKSTLLKILSRITAPTEGTMRYRGRLASLLEVGTGFHRELTGRENVYLNGSILGMRRAEIDQRFDEIVEFAGVTKFIDTPVKFFSSGMYVRLAFAVAAHLRADILIVDEVLAVGDAAFQKKCLGKMQEVATAGRTVLFVSHNTAAVRRLCRGAIWLKEGRLHRVGETAHVTEEYLREAPQAQSIEDLPKLIAAIPADPVFRLLDVSVSQEGSPTTAVANGRPVRIEMSYEVFQPTRGLRVYFDLCDEDRDILIRSFNDEQAEEVPIVEPGIYRAEAEIPADLLAPRDYLLVLQATIYNVRSFIPHGLAIPLHVAATSGTNRAYANEPIRAKMLPRIAWRTTKAEG